MGLIKNKNGFIFSFLALFISILIFAYANSNFHNNNNFKEEANFNELRITSINSEIYYFKNIYLRDIIKYSSRLALDSIINYSKTPANYIKLNKNISYLNLLLKEALLNGTLNGNIQPLLIDKTVSNFTKLFINEFNKNQKGNFSFKIINLSIYELTPYYVELEIYSDYNITFEDNLSNWKFKDFSKISVPVIELEDPQFILNGITTNSPYLIKPNTLYSNSKVWNMTTFKESLIESYSSLYMDKTYNYMVGLSFLRRLLNSTKGSYDGVTGFWSFDYDEKLNNLYDTSQNNNHGFFNGNTYLVLNFNDGSFNDSSNYNMSIFNSNCLIEDSSYGKNQNSSKFNGINSYLKISNTDFNLNNENKFSISLWINPKSYDSSNAKNSTLFQYGSNNNDLISLNIRPDKKIEFIVGVHNSGSYHKFISTNIYQNLTLNNYSHIAVTFNGDTGIGKIYINGIIMNILDDGLFDKTTPISNFLTSSSSIYIGNDNTLTRAFNGSIDEFVFYTKELTNFEVSKLFEQQKTINIDYQDSLHGKSIEFDGKNDYINISLDSKIKNTFTSNFSIEFWIYPLLNASIGSQGILSFQNISQTQNNPNGMNFYLNNTNNKLEWSIQPNNLGNLLSDYNLNKNNYYLATWDGITAKLYHNSKLVASNNDIMSFKNLKSLFISYNSSDMFFNGKIDEVKIYNRTLENYEIKEHYYNYDSEAKGCCNYLTLINPFKMGLNIAPYTLNNISYVSDIFFKYYNNGINYNITTWNISNITNNYPNYQLDACALTAYNIYYYNNATAVDEYQNLGNFNDSCSNFIKFGIY